MTEVIDDNWYYGHLGAAQGIFPTSYVEKIEAPDLPPPPALPAQVPTLQFKFPVILKIWVMMRYAIFISIPALINNFLPCIIISRSINHARS